MVYGYSTFEQLAHAIQALPVCPIEAHVISITDCSYCNYITIVNLTAICAYCNDILKMCTVSDPAIGLPLTDLISQYEVQLASTQAKLDAHLTSAASPQSYLAAAPSRNAKRKLSGIQALKAVRKASMQGNKLFVYYTLMNKLFADAGSTTDTAIPPPLQVRYFIDGLNPNSIPSNLKLVMGTYLERNPASTVTDFNGNRSVFIR